jgi:cyclophilin family peptidyl-prolyl cis-trans isomerase
MAAVLVAGCQGDSRSDGSDSATEDSTRRGTPPIKIDPLKHSIIESDKSYSARVVTGKGVLALQLFAEDAPYTVSNFIHLANAGFYDGLTFHLVVPGFIAQTGDPTGDGQGGPGYVFHDEISGQSHLRGTVSMANAGEPDTNGSQFFICLGDLTFLDEKHTVFGEVVEGMEILDQLEEGDRVERIEIMEGSSP